MAGWRSSVQQRKKCPRSTELAKWLEWEKNPGDVQLTKSTEQPRISTWLLTAASLECWWPVFCWLVTVSVLTQFSFPAVTASAHPHPFPFQGRSTVFKQKLLPCKRTYLQHRNRVTDEKNKLMVTRKESGGYKLGEWD